MKIGIQLYLGGDSADPEFLGQAARAVEEREFHSLWLPEHVVLTPEIRSHYPYSVDGSFPFDTKALPLEPFTGLAFAAAQTSRIRLGTGICILPQRHPVYTAKQAADVDVLSGGRLDFGIGVGWLAEEFDTLGVPFERRGARARDYIGVMKTLWCDELCQYEGEFYSLPPCYQSPKPVQKPHPPLYFGGESDAALTRVARFGQGWFAAGMVPEKLPERLQKLTALLEREGRGLEDIEIFVGPPDGKADLETVTRFRDEGAAQVILGLTSRNFDRFMRRLDGLYEGLVRSAQAL
jgi:probable F420-dependent oxidoreductase